MMYNIDVKTPGVDVCVIGGVCVDVFGSAHSAIVPEDSNIGTITTTFGGVGRNIASNLAKLGISVELITVLGDDDNGKSIKAHCHSENIGLNYSLKTPGKTASYLSINQANGDIYCAIADMAINDKLTPDFFADKMAFINSCKLAVIEANIPAEAIEYLLDNLTVPVYADPVSVAKAPKLKDRLTKITGLKPNCQEAEIILDEQLAPEILVTSLLDKGLCEVYLTMGPRGLISGNNFQLFQLPIIGGPVVNTTGCGDAFLAGVIYGVLHDCDLITKSRYGLAAASIACRSLGSISEYLNEEELLKATGEPL